MALNGKRGDWVTAGGGTAASVAFVYIHLLQVCDSLWLLMEFELIFFLHFDFKQKLSKVATDLFFVFLDCWSFITKEILWKPNPTNILRDHRSRLNVTVWRVYLSQQCEACGKWGSHRSKTAECSVTAAHWSVNANPTQWVGGPLLISWGGREEQRRVILKLRGWRKKKESPRLFERCCRAVVAGTQLTWGG